MNLPPGTTEGDVAESAAYTTIELLAYLPDSVLAEVYLAVVDEADERELSKAQLRELAES